MNHKTRTELADRLTKEFANKGKLIEGGWAAFVVLNNPSKEQHDSLRHAFLAGVEHLFSSMVGPMLDSDYDPTDADMRRMDLLGREIFKIREELILHYRKMDQE